MEDKSIRYKHRRQARKSSRADRRGHRMTSDVASERILRNHGKKVRLTAWSKMSKGHLSFPVCRLYSQ